MRVPKQCPDVTRSLDVKAADSGSTGVAPAGVWDVLRSVGGKALRGALTGIASGL